jgi:hypothetical protein
MWRVRGVRGRWRALISAAAAARTLKRVRSMSKLEPSGFLKVNSTVARRVRYGSSAYSFGGNG